MRKQDSVSGSNAIPVILCCAESDAVTVTSIARELEHEGTQVRLVSGIEMDSGPLSELIDTVGGPAVFVLCQSASLDRQACRRWAGLFSARGGGGQRLVTVTLAANRPLSVMPTIRGALAEFRRPTDSMTAARSSDDFRREVIAAPVAGKGPSAAESASWVRRIEQAEDSEYLARELALGLAQAEALLDRRFARVIDEAHSASTRTSDSTAAAQAEDSRREPSWTKRAPVAPQLATIAPAVPERPIAGEAPSNVAPLLAPEQVRSDPSLATPVAPRPPRATLPAPTVRPRGNRWLLAVAGTAMVTITGLAALQILGAPHSDVEDEPVAAAIRRAGTDGRQGPATSKGPVGGVIEAAGRTPPTTVPARPPREHITGAGRDNADPLARPASPVPLPPPPAVAPAEPDEPNKSTASSDGTKHSQLPKGAREVGQFYVTEIADNEMSWAEAQRRCRSQRMGDGRRFRLPSRHELRRLKNAGIIRKGAFWSRERRASDEAFVVDAATGAEQVYLTVEPTGAVVCTRAVD